MDDIDRLFGSAPARSAAPGVRSAGGNVPAARSAGSSAPWDDDVPTPPHPSEGQGRGAQGGYGQPSRSAAPQMPVQGRGAPPVAPAVSRSPVVRPLSDARREHQPADRQAGPDDDGRGGWSGGEEDRGTSQPAQGGSREERDYYSVHIYGGKSALCFQADTTRSGREGETNTVRLEAAPSSGPRQYNWQDKIAVQFTVKELPFVLAVFMGWMPSVTFKAHGPQQDKGFSMQHQDGGKMFVRVWQGKRAMAVPLYAQDMYAVVALLLRQMSKNQAFLGVDGVLAVVRQLSSVYQEAGLGVQPMPERSAA